MPQDHSHSTPDATLLGVATEDVVDSLEALRRKSNLFGTGEWEVLRSYGRRDQAENSERNRYFMDHFHLSEIGSTRSSLGVMGRTR